MRVALLMISILALVTSTAGPAAAGKKSGVTMPDTVTVANKSLTLNGMGLREATFLKVNVYVAGLYVEKVSSNPTQLITSDDQVKQLVLRFVRDVDSEDIVKAWNDGFKGNSTPALLTSLKPMIARLNAWMPSFDKGDTLVFTYVPTEGVTVMVNGVTKGTLNSPNFARALFAIWLGPKPPTGALKKGLLGNHGAAGA